MGLIWEWGVSDCWPVQGWILGKFQDLTKQLSSVSNRALEDT